MGTSKNIPISGAIRDIHTKKEYAGKNIDVLVDSFCSLRVDSFRYPCCRYPQNTHAMIGTIISARPMPVISSNAEDIVIA